MLCRRIGFLVLTGRAMANGGCHSRSSQLAVKYQRLVSTIAAVDEICGGMGPEGSLSSLHDEGTFVLDGNV